MGRLVDKRAGLMASLGYLVLSLVYTWPLLPNFFVAIPRGWPDSYQNLWNFWWMRSSLFERFSNPYITNTLYFPYRADADPIPLYIYTLQPIISIPGGLVSAVLGQAAAYNLIILVGYVGTGWAAFALTHYFVGSQYRLAAFLAGAIYTFAPYHQHSLARGQTNVFWQQFIPLYILFLHKALSKESPRRLYPVLAIACLWLTFLSDWYYFAYLGLYSVALYLFLLWKSRRKDFFNWRELTLRAGIIGIGALVLPAPILWKALTYPQDGFIVYNFSQKAEETILESTSLFSWFQPQRNSFNGWTPDYLSFLTLLLAGLGVWVCLKRFQMRWLWWWVGLLVVTLILSLGPYLRLTGSEDSAQTLKSGFPLPYQLLEKLPLLDYSRSPLRLLSLSTLALSLLAGAGMAWLFPRVANLRFNLGKAVPALILVVLMADTLSLPVTLDNLYYPKFLEQIASDPDTSYGLLELPITTHYTRDNRRMFFQSIHHHPITSGYLSRRVMQYYDEKEPIGRFFSLSPLPPEAIFPDNPQPQLKVLQLYNIGYVLLYRDEGLFTEAELEGQRVYLNGLLGNSVFDDGRVTIYKVPTPAATAKPALAVSSEGGYDLQKLADGTNYRWSDGMLKLLIIAAKDGTEAQLDFTAWSLPPDNRLGIKLNDAPLLTLPLAQSPQPFSLNLKLKAGRNFITFESSLPASYPQDLKLPFSDTRKLAFALGEVKLK